MRGHCSLCMSIPAAFRIKLHRVCGWTSIHPALTLPSVSPPSPQSSILVSTGWHAPSANRFLAGGEARDYLFVHAAGHQQGGFAAKRGITDAIQPSIHARASRIAAQGGGTRRRRINPKHVIGYVVLTLILSPLLGMLVVLVGLLTLGTIFASLGLGLTAASAILA